jgi:carboxynorspermidine decarboxylase
LDTFFNSLPTPCYLLDEGLIKKNLEILLRVQRETGCKILLALKGFSMFSVFPLVGKYLAGVTASSLFETRLGREEMGKEVHIFAPAYIEEEFADIMALCDHIVFNSFDQWGRYRGKVLSYGKKISCGIRVNPEYSEIKTEIYNPCAPNSRLGVKLSDFRPKELEGIEGLHFHTMCEQNSDVLERTLAVFDSKFGKYLNKMKWVNFGGGHHITRPDYDIDKLKKSIQYMRDTYSLEVYLEPGEAVALDAGYLVAKVLDIVDGGLKTAILDTSAVCHMPDVLEMPYRPEIVEAGEPGEKKWTYRLGGLTCLAGDVIGDYSFDNPLLPGDRLIFTDMAHYTMVKNNTFNGVNLPSIVLKKEDGGVEVIRRFGYDDYKVRLS